jgi:hypothetical protein
VELQIETPILILSDPPPEADPDDDEPAALPQPVTRDAAKTPAISSDPNLLILFFIDL